MKSGDAGCVEHEYVELLKKCLTASIYDESSWRVIDPFPCNPLKMAAVNVLQKRSLLLVKALPFNSAARLEGRDWPGIGFTMIGHKRLDNLQLCIEEVLAAGIPGDFIETGAWRGGAAIFMRAMLKMHGVKDRTIWVADSFQGLPKPVDQKDGVDLSTNNYLKVSLSQVKDNFAKFNLLDQQVQFLVGWFKDTLPAAPIDFLAILRLDGDLYVSTMDALENLYHKVSPGGYVIVDDYYSSQSCQRAVDDFLNSNHASAQINRIDQNSAFWKVTCPGTRKKEERKQL